MAVNEGKSLVAANLAVTLVKHFGYKVLLVEGDLHRPTLSSLAWSLTDLEGINQWWVRREEDKEIASYVYKLDDMPLWFLSAGSTVDQPTQILQSARFAETFVRLVGGFDWVVVDSTPMSPTVDANLWSRLVDGTLLVVREGVAPIKALRTGVRGLDNPKWLGIVLLNRGFRVRPRELFRPILRMVLRRKKTSRNKQKESRPSSMIRLPECLLSKAHPLFWGFSELCLIALAFVAATMVARSGDRTMKTSVMLQLRTRAFKNSLRFLAAFIICMYYFDLYDSSILSNRREVVIRLVQVLGTMCILLAVVYYFYPPLELGRGIILIGLLIVAIILTVWRGLFAALNQRPEFAERTMIFGDEPSASRLLRELESRPELGLSVVARILAGGNGSYELNWEHSQP